MSARKQRSKNTGELQDSAILDARMQVIMDDAKYSSQFVQSMRDAQTSAKLVANQLDEIVSLNSTSSSQLDELKEEIMQKVHESESSQFFK